SADEVAQQIAASNSGKLRSEAMPDSQTRGLAANGFAPNKDIKLAASAALLALSTNSDGSLPADGIIGKRTINLPPHKMYEMRQAGTDPETGAPLYYREDVPGPSSATQDLRVTDLTSFLKANVAGDGSAEKIVSADMLVKLGDRDQLSYCAVLRDTLNDQ